MGLDPIDDPKWYPSHSTDKEEIVRLKSLLDEAKKALEKLREEVPRLIMPHECGGSWNTCERIILQTLARIKGESK